MKRHISLILLVLLCLTPVSVRYWIQETYGAECENACSDDTVGQLARANLAVLGASTGAAAATTFCSSATSTPNVTGILCEDFEGAVECYTGYSSNCRAAWGALTGVPDFDYGTAIDGTYSLNADAYTQNADVRTKRVFTESAGVTYYGYLKMKIVNYPLNDASNEILQLWSGNGGSKYCTIWFESTAGGSFISVTANGGSKVATTGTVSEGTTYNFWFKTVVGTGANAECHVAFSTGTTRPNDGDAAYAKSVDGTSTATLDAFGVYVDNLQVKEGNDIVVDNILISASELKGVPN